MASQCVFKVSVYLSEDPNVCTEIKKFQLGPDICTNYNHFLGRLRNYYKFERIKVFWTDSEGDKIKIDSDEDLQMALNESTEGALKLKAILEDSGNNDLNAEDDGEGMELDLVETVDVDQTKRSVDGNYILSLMVYVVQCLGLEPVGQTGGEVSVTSYMIGVAALLSTKLTKSALLVTSIFLLTVLSMFLPEYIINSIIYFILAFSLGLPIATLVLGHLMFGLISVSPSFVVTFLSMWALRTLLYRKRQHLLRLNLEYWNTRLEQTLTEEMKRNVRQQ